MADIYEQLAKHFSGENILEDQAAINKFKADHQTEYEMLKKLWKTEGVSVSKVDTQSAYAKIIANKTERVSKAKVVPLYPRLAKIASIAAIFLLLAYFAIPYLSVPEEALLVELVGDGSKEGITLDDGSIIYLNKDAKLSYPKEFNGQERLVSLDGEAYFDIARDVSRPFKIKTNHSEVEVLGTSFNIDTNTKRTEVAVTSGKVKVSALFNNDEAILIKNQGAIVDNNVLNSYTLENENFIAWKTGIFSFKDESITTVIAELNTYYADDINLNNKSADCVLSASFDKTSISEVLEIVTLSCNLNLTETNGIYELK